MKKRFFTRTISMVLTLMMILSVATVATASAATIEKDWYTIVFTVADGENGTCEGTNFRLHGDKGWTQTITLPSYYFESSDTYSIGGSFRYVGNIDMIEIETNSHDDPLFLEKIEVYTLNHEESFTVHVGQWIDEDTKYLEPDTDVYKVTVKTANVNNAGTNAFIDATLRTDKGEYSYRLDDVCKGDPFEKGDEREFYFGTGTEDGVFESIQFTLSNDMSTLVNLIDSVTADGWKLENIKVEKVQGNIKENSFTITANQWLSIDDVARFGKESGHSLVYKVEIKTSDTKQSGTDADISLQVHGENGSSQVTNIDHFAGSGNNFEKGKTDKFQVAFTPIEDPIGEVTKISVFNEGNGIGPGWKIEYIKLTEIVADGEEGKTYTFNINQWLDGGKCDTYYNPKVS